jgi:hypothetical protein
MMIRWRSQESQDQEKDMREGGARLRGHCAWPVAVFLLFAPLTIGRADVLPPGEMRKTCSLEENCPAGQECLLCTFSIRDREACTRTLPSLGFKEQCGTGGPSGGSELWCRAATGVMDASIVIPPPREDEPTSLENSPQTLNVVACKPAAASRGGGC